MVCAQSRGFEASAPASSFPIASGRTNWCLATWGDRLEHQAVIEHGSDYSINAKIFDDAILSGDAGRCRSSTGRILVRPRHALPQMALDQEARRTVEWRRPGQPTILLADIPARDAGWLVPFFELAFAVDPQGGATAFWPSRTRAGVR